MNYNESQNIIPYINSPDNSKSSLALKRATFDVEWRSSFLLSGIQNKTEKREILTKCVNKIRQCTQVKSYSSLTQQQLNLIDDQASSVSRKATSKKITQQESRFEKIYYQTKLQTSKFRQLVLLLIENKNVQNILTIKPSHPCIIFWNFVKLIFMLHIFVIFPLIDSFGNQISNFLKSQEILFQIEFAFLLCDVAFKFNVQIYKDGQAIKDRIQIAKLYIKKDFIIDIIGIAGFSLFLFNDIFYIRYVYLFKVTDIQKFIGFIRHEIDPQNKYKNHIKLIHLLIVIFFLAHIIACAWIAAGKSNEINCWINSKDLNNKQWYIQYGWAFYFAILTMTTVGYGDIVPINDIELIACILIVLLSSGIFAYTLNTITTVLKDLDQEKSYYKKEAKLIQNYLMRKNCDMDVQRRALQYLKQVWKSNYQQQQSIEQKVFQKLNPSLQQEINLQDKGQWLLKIPFLVNNFNIECIKELMQYVEEISYQPGELFYITNGIYLLYKGNADICWGEKQNPKLYSKLYEGDYQGLLNIFNLQNDKYYLKSQNFSTFYYISTQQLIDVLARQDNETFCMIKDQVRNDNYQNLYLTCPLCRKDGHIICKEILFQPQTSLILAKHNKPHIQERQFYKRNIKKYSILNNFQIVQNDTCKFIRDNQKLIRLQSLNDSECGNDLESIELQSSQSWKYDSSQMDERYNQNEKEYQQQHSNTVKRDTFLKRQSVLQHQYTKNLLKHPKESPTQHKSISMEESAQQQVKQFNFEDQQFSQPKELFLNIDILKSFNRYFKQYNVDLVIKRLNQRKKTTKKRFKKMERFYN